MAAGAAFVPGTVVHGAGHFVVGEAQTGWRLLAAQGTGVGLLALGIGGLAVTGASPWLIQPFIFAATGGVALFVLPLFADLYGVIAPAIGAGEPLRVTPSLSVSVGYRHVDNPVFGYRHLSRTHVEISGGAWGARPVHWRAVDGDNVRTEVPLYFRPIDRRGDGLDGTFVEVELGYSLHQHGGDAFTEQVGHALTRARLDLAHIGPTLAGSFVQAGVGYGAGWVSYEGLPGDATQLTLAEVAWGFYLGRRPQFGEFAIYYDHRHDGYAAGLKSTGVGSGAIGHVGARVERSVWGDFGLAADVEVGSALVAGASLVYRHGAGR